MNWYEQIQAMPLEQILRDCGHTVKNINSSTPRFQPCPSCGSSRSSKDPRPCVGVVGTYPKKGWFCNVCQVSGSKFDIISYYLKNGPTSSLENFRDLKVFVDNTTPNTEPQMIQTPPPPQYPPIKEVTNILTNGCEPLRNITPPPKLEEFLTKRKLDRTKIPCGLLNPKWSGWDDLTMVQSPNGKNTRWFPQQWAQRFGLVFPLVNYHGKIRSLLGRTWYNQNRKTSVPIKYTTKGLLLANHRARKWMREKHFEKLVIICEGEIDYATACQESDMVVIGIRSGSIDVCRKLPWRAGMDVYIATDNDETGDKYAEKISKLVGKAHPYRVRYDNE